MVYGVLSILFVHEFNAKVVNNEAKGDIFCLMLEEARCVLRRVVSTCCKMLYQFAVYKLSSMGVGGTFICGYRLGPYHFSPDCAVCMPT